MHCEIVETLIPRLVLGEIDAGSAEGREVAGHMASCRKCAEAAEQMRAALRLAKEGIEATPAPTLSRERREAILNLAAECAGGWAGAGEAKGARGGGTSRASGGAGEILSRRRLQSLGAYLAGKRLGSFKRPRARFGFAAAALIVIGVGLVMAGIGDNITIAHSPKMAGIRDNITIAHSPEPGMPAASAPLSQWSDHNETADNMDTATAKGAPGAMRDQSLGGTGDVGAISVGGGGGGRFGARGSGRKETVVARHGESQKPESTAREYLAPQIAPSVTTKGMLETTLARRAPVSPRKPAQGPSVAGDESGRKAMDKLALRVRDPREREEAAKSRETAEAAVPERKKSPVMMEESRLWLEKAAEPAPTAKEEEFRRAASVDKKGAALMTKREPELDFADNKLRAPQTPPSTGDDLSRSPRMQAALKLTQRESEAGDRSGAQAGEYAEADKLITPPPPAAPSAVIRLSPEEAAKLQGDEDARRGAQQAESIKADLPPEKPPEEIMKAIAPKAAPIARPVFRALPVNPFVMTEKDALSTFSLDTDTASFSIALNYIRRGYLPPEASVRMEEFVNAFDYNYPRQSERVFTVHAEGAPSPFGKNLALLKIGVKGKVLGRDGRKPAHLVFAIDCSGSMAWTDRMPLVQYALDLVVGELSPSDRVSIVAYATEARLLAEAASASDAKAITGVVDSIRCGGSTNLARGVELAYSIAAREFRSGEINRIILCSDGVATVGYTEAAEVLRTVEEYKKQGITFTSVGFGMGSYNDAMMESLADKGDGNYVFVGSREDARRVFVEDLAATLQTIAKDAKIQVKFDPRRVRRYRLIGYENRDIRDEDFRNDAVDAGEVGSGQSATALYELELLGPGPGARDMAAPDIGVVYVRYVNLDTNKVEEISRRIESSAIRPRAPQESPRLYLAAAAAEFAEILRGSEHAKDASLDEVAGILGHVAAALPLDGKVQTLLWMVRHAVGLPRAE